MKNRIFYVAIIMAVLLSACKPAPQLSFMETLEVASAGGNVTVDVSANYAWTASSSSSWIRVTSSGEKTLGLSITENGGYDSRTGNVTLTCEDVVKTLKVTQNQKDIIITDGDKINIEYNAQNLTINVQGNIPYQCKIDSEAAAWLRQVTNKGLVSSQVNLHADENLGKASRTATVTLQNTEKGYSKTFSVVQSGTPDLLRITHSAKTFTVPTFGGTNLSAEVDWGDGKVEKYKANTVHTYTSAKTYCITIKASNTSAFVISDLVGVESIDFSRM